MLTTKIRLLIAYTLFLGSMCFAQSETNLKQGLNSDLYNGKYYSYFLPRSVNDNQFLFSKDFTKGIVWKNNQEFDGLLLNYDIVNQELILKFKTNLGADKIIALSMTNLDSFALNDKHFVLKHDIEEDHLIYQKIVSGNFAFYINFHKELRLQSQINEISYQMTNLNTEIYFANDTIISRINKNKSFFKLLDEEKRKTIKKYMKSKKYKIHKMQDDEYLDLLMFMQKANYEKY